MKIASTGIKRYRRKLLQPLHTAHGQITGRDGFIITLTSDEGHTGFGEVPLSLFGPQQENSDAERLLSAAVETLGGKNIPSSLEDAEVDIEHLLPAADPSVYFGLETALCDLAAQIVQHPLSRWLSANPRQSVPVNYLILRPVEDWDRLAATVEKGGYRAVKAKVAVGPVDDDFDFIERLRSTLGKDIVVRLDANRGWDFNTAVAAMNRAAKYEIDYIEEPLTDPGMDSFKELRSKTGVPIALDETLREIGDLEAALSEKIADVLILKPSVIGGMARTLDLIKRASKKEHRFVITSNLETEIGTTALLHLAAAVPGNLPPCGFDTLRLFENADPALTKVENGTIKVPSRAGLGIGEALWQRL